MTSHHKQWLADYHRRADAARLEREAQHSLLPSKIASMPSVDPDLLRRIECGAVPTKPASRGPRPFFDRLLPVRASRFDEAYPAGPGSPPQRAANRRREAKIASRIYGSWSDMPPEMRYHFTEKERAALHVVATQFVRRGYCDMSLKQIGDIAGVSRSTAKAALAEARKLGLVSVTYRKRDAMNNLPNVVVIVSEEWLNWLESLAVKKRSTLKNSPTRQGRKGDKAPSQGAHEDVDARSAGIPLRNPLKDGRNHRPWHGPNGSEWRRMEERRRDQQRQNRAGGVV